MCFGVRDAIAEAERLAVFGPLTVLGELVHNPVVHERLAAQGITESSNANAGRAMITAHGTSDAQRLAWHAAGVELADGTCPLVRHAHTQLKQLVAAGYFPVVIGKRGHVEVLGLTGDFPQAVVISSEQEVHSLPGHPLYGVISQTTQPIERVREIVDAVRRAWPQSLVRFVDTVCKPTKDRQSALKKLLATADVVVVIGGRASNNTRELIETCRSAGRRAIHVERPEEIRPADFIDARTVGVTAGTSTLPETVKAVVVRLKQLAEEGRTQ
jgi:4-hydroxy-3-methylbut-2-enyl diphosphate reductase